MDSLRHSDLGQYLNAQELENLVRYCKVIDFFPDDTILKQGMVSNGVYFVMDGTVTVTAKILGEGVKVLGLLGPGNFLGEISFIGEGQCAASIIANTQVKCLLIPRTYLEFLSVYFPEMKYNLYRAISKQVCDRLKQMHSNITEFISHTDMITQSIDSLEKPSEISFEEYAIDINHLYEFSLFHSFSQEEIKELLHHAVILKFAKNCNVIIKEENACCCYIVIRGAVESSIVKDNKIAKLSVIGPSILFANIACIDKNSSFNITFSTCEPAFLIKLSESALLFLQKNKPIIWYKIFNLICRSLVELLKSIDKLHVRLHVENYNR